MLVKSASTFLLLLSLLSAVQAQSLSLRTENLTESQFNETSSKESCFSNSALCKSEGEETKTVEAKKEKLEGKFWYNSVPVPPIAVAESETLPEGICKRQLRKYLEDLRNGKMWATQMYDSSAKLPHGIIEGQTGHLGTFDQCYGLEAQVHGVDGLETVKGRYCLVDYKYEQKNATDYKGTHGFEFDPNDSVWEAIRERGDYRRFPRYKLQMALCIPASCSADDVEKALQGPFQAYAETYNFLVKVSVDPYKCQTRDEEPEFTLGAFVFCCLMFTFFALVVAASFYDKTLTSEKEKLGIPMSRQLLLCFSAQRNMKSIMEINYKHRGMDTIHSLRTWAISLVVFGHRFIELFVNTMYTRSYHETSFGHPAYIFLHNGTVIVDGFFAIGGILTCFGFLEYFDKAKRLNFPMLVFVRFIRFTPLYSLLLLFHVYVFPLLGTGPYWKSLIVSESENCAATWWVNLLYLNNYFTMDKLCVFQSWYMAVDFHCYIFGIFLIYVFWKCPRPIGYALLIVVTLISHIIPTYVTYVDNLQPIYIAYPRLNHTKEDPYFKNFYVKSHLRLGSYLIGAIAGAMVYDYQTATWRIPKRWSRLLSILLVPDGLIFLLMAFAFLDPNNRQSQFWTAIYGSTHRAAFALSFCAVVVLCTMGDGIESLYNFFTPRWVQPLGRMSYSVFITHFIIQMYQMATMRVPVSYSVNRFFWIYVPDLFFAFLLALFITLGIEGPFRKMEKFMIPTKRSAISSAKNKKLDKNANSAKSIEELMSEKMD